MENNEIANLIKSTKQQHKEAQRELSKLVLDEVYTRNTCYAQPEKYHFTISPILQRINSTRNTIQSLKSSFRIQHIYNSMLRGKTISQIEPKVSDDEVKTEERKHAYISVKYMLKENGKEWLE